MARDWESQFREWGKPSGKTEQDRCDNAVSAIRNAVKASDKLKNRNISIFAQGSYRNNTNVGKDSDVDIGLLCKDTFFHQLSDGTTTETCGIIPATYHFEQYKNEVEAGIGTADVPGFLIECLVWNVPNDKFQNSNYRSDVRSALAFIFNNMRKQEDCKEWGEVSELIYLFHSSQQWTWQQTHSFTDAAWDYIGFED